jgi:hypothetical protein
MPRRSEQAPARPANGLHRQLRAALFIPQQPDACFHAPHFESSNQAMFTFYAV